MSETTDAPTNGATEELSDELARKYDPERLLKLVAARAGRGEALDASIRAKYEKRFGVDLGHVRVITGEFAEEFNRQRDAHAVTVGGTGLILMGNTVDKAVGTRGHEPLLAHELTHVAQATRGLHNRAAAPDFTQADEIEAHEVEREVEAEAEAKRPTEADQKQAAMAAETAKQEQLEKVKARVLEMMAEATRNQYVRNGSTRRP